MRREEDGAYYDVVDVDSSQFSAKLFSRWDKLEKAIENRSLDPDSELEASKLIEKKSIGKELCENLQEVYDILFLEEFDDMEKFMKFQNYYTALKHEYDSLLLSYDNLIVKIVHPTKRLHSKL